MFASIDGRFYPTKDQKLAADSTYRASFERTVWLEPIKANGTATVQASLIDRTGI